MKQLVFVHDQQESPAPRAQFLEQAGYEVHLYASCNDCIDKIRHDKPDVLLLDILIEGENGFEFCRSVRRIYSASELPIILMSKIYRTRAFREEAKMAGAQAYFLRPVKLEDLVREVEEHCSNDLPSLPKIVKDDKAA